MGTNAPPSDPERHHWYFAAATLALLLPTTACERNHYELRMTAEHGALQRDLTCWREVPSDPTPELRAFPREELDHLATVYGIPMPAELVARHAFSAPSTVVAPDDLGGSGRLVHLETSLGTFSMYAERIRGSDDLVADLARTHRSVDAFLALATEWVNSLLDEPSARDRFGRFADAELRHDLHNLALYSWSLSIEVVPVEELDEKSWAEALLARALQYLLERDYLLPEEASILAVGTYASRMQIVGDAVQRLIVEKAGLGSVPNRIARLRSDRKALERSFAEFVSQWSPYQAWKDERGPTADEKVVGAYDYAGELLAEAFLPIARLRGDHLLEARLDLPVAPFRTNGTWDADELSVRWSERLPSWRSGEGYPRLLFAAWCVPDPKAQRQRFGRVILDGEDLAAYCLAFSHLSATRQEQWLAFLASLDREKEPMPVVDAFHFPGDEGDRELGPLREVLSRMD
jgi:hypothetical protein